MKHLIDILQYVAVVTCGTCLLLVGSSMACSCNHTTSQSDSTTYAIQGEVVNDTDCNQLAACERVLDECVKANVLNNKGVDAYKRIAAHPSVLRYIELITECESEEGFYDTIGSGDAWLEYCECVLEPRGFLN